MGYDHRVDVWGIGQVCYMLLTSDWMFKTHANLHKAKWSISNLECSIEIIRFICDTVTYYMEKRPWPDSVKDHPYFKVDLAKLPTIRQKLPELQQRQLKCFEPDSIGYADDTLWFDACDVSIFEEFDKAFSYDNNSPT